jgi:hypothetical protein
MIVWLRVPHLNPSRDGVLFMYYGKSEGEITHEPAQVWSERYEGVWHMEDPPNSSIHDSANSHDGAMNGNIAAENQASGKIGEAIRFDGIDDFYNVGTWDIDQAEANATTGLTLEAWIKATSHMGPIIGKAKGLSATHIAWMLFCDGSTCSFRLQTVSDSKDIVPQGVIYQTVGLNIWYHLVGTYDGQQMRLYLNGDEVKSQPHSGLILADESVSIGLGGCSTQQYFGGILDEVRVSKTARTAAWIKTQYNNDVHRQDFISLSVEESKF